MSDIAEARRQRAEAETQLAYTRGRIDAILDEVTSDPEHVEMLRCLAWARTGQRLGMNRDGKIVGAPDGWPEGVDPDGFVDEWVAGQRAKHAGPPDDATPAPASETVRRFRELVGS